MSDLTPCPTPEKFRYGTRRMAKHYAKIFSRNGLGKLLKPYRCTCGQWHLTSTPRDGADLNKET